MASKSQRQPNVHPQKLKIVKKALIHWNKASVSNVMDGVKMAKEVMDRIQTKLQADPLNIENIQDERKVVHDYVNKARVESFNRQKSREQRIAMGDGNNKFFFRSVQMR